MCVVVKKATFRVKQREVGACALGQVAERREKDNKDGVR